MQPHKHTGLDSPKLATTNIRTTDGNAYLTDSEVMHTKDIETVAGIKTFSSIPVLPNSDPTADNEIVRKSYIDDNSFDVVSEVSNVLIDSADNEREIQSIGSSYTLDKQITFNEVGGNITAKFDLKDDNGSGGCFGKVYINGSPVGIEREETASVWTTYSENFSISNGDLVQLYTKYDNSGGGTGGLCRNFRLYYRKNPLPTAGTVNLD